MKKKGTEKKSDKQNTTSKMIALNQNISVITLSIHDLKTPIKRQRLIDMIKLQDSLMYVYNKPTLNIKTWIRLKWKDTKKLYHENSNQKKVGMGILILQNVHIKRNNISKDKEKHCIMMKDQFI